MSQNNPLRTLLEKQDFLLLDGAMATELEARGCNPPIACGQRKCW